MTQKLVSRTHFRYRYTENQGWQWFWTTKSANNVDTVAVGGEGYGDLYGAYNGYFSSQGDSDWVPGKPTPPGYVVEKFDAHHFVIAKFTNEVTEEETEEVTEETQEK